MSEYNWRGELYPRFYPVQQYDNPNLYYVELSWICYPYSNGSVFNPDAYPPELRRFPHGYEEAPTQFFFQVRDDDGNVFENLSFDEAASISDDFNDAWHDLLSECIETWNWDNMPFELKSQDLAATK